MPKASEYIQKEYVVDKRRLVLLTPKLCEVWDDLPASWRMNAMGVPTKDVEWIETEQSPDDPSKTIVRTYTPAHFVPDAKSVPLADPKETKTP